MFTHLASSSVSSGSRFPGDVPEGNPASASFVIICDGCILFIAVSLDVRMCRCMSARVVATPRVSCRVARHA